MLMFAVEALKALHGDALLLHGTDSLIMVDGGPRKVYDRTLRPRLIQLASAGQAAKIDLLMVSHIDDDHINGVLDLMSELVEAKFEHRAPVASIRNLWHNSFLDEVLAGNSHAGGAAEADVAGATALADLADTSAVFGDVIQEQSRLVLTSVRQGRRLRRDANLVRTRINDGFLDGVVLRQGNNPVAKRIGEFSLAVLGPRKSQLDELRNKWKRDLKNILERHGGQLEALELAANLDRSVANLASLVVQVSRFGKTALLTGDARSDHIMTALAEGSGERNEVWPVDLLKIPHHGSDRNVTREFFVKVPARHYVISGDGKHGNPDPGTFEMIFSASRDRVFDLHLTYGPHELRRHREFDWRGFKQVMNRYNGWCRLRYPNSGQSSIAVNLA